MTETSGESVVVRAPAKVNLGLWVGPPRPDGFHSLATVFHAVDLFDELVVSLAPEWSVEVSGRHTESVPTDRGNLVWRAGQLIAEHFDLDDACRIHIHKSIPVAGGMAGGSADAAATLVGLDSLLTLGLDRDSLMDLAADLGSDVPFSVAGGTALGSGRGESSRRCSPRASITGCSRCTTKDCRPRCVCRVRPAAWPAHGGRAGTECDDDGRVALRGCGRGGSRAAQRLAARGDFVAAAHPTHP